MEHEADADIPPRPDPELLARPILEVAMELLPQNLAADELSRRVVFDPTNREEVEAVKRTVCLLVEVGLFRVEDGRIVPTKGGQLVFKLLDS